MKILIVGDIGIGHQHFVETLKAEADGWHGIEVEVVPWQDFYCREEPEDDHKAVMDQLVKECRFEYEIPVPESPYCGIPAREKVMHPWSRRKKR